LLPIPSIEPQQLKRLVEDLGNETFAVRQKATAELERLVDRAEPDLRKLLAKPMPLETTRRLEAILEKFNAIPFPDLTAEELRAMRGVEALELAAMPACRSILEDLTKGAAGHWLTRHAQAALTRLNRAAEFRHKPKSN
jgi:hypothetical protein